MIVGLVREAVVIAEDIQVRPLIPWLFLSPDNTTRINRPELPDLLKGKTMTTWNTLTGCITTTPKTGGREFQSGEDVLCLRWENNNIVRLLTTVHYWNEYILSERRKPRTTSTNAALAQQVFGNQERKTLPIPKVVNDYNHHMNSVDLAD